MQEWKYRAVHSCPRHLSVAIGQLQVLAALASRKGPQVPTGETAKWDPKPVSTLRGKNYPSWKPKQKI